MGYCFSGLGYDFGSCDFAAKVIGVHLVALFRGGGVDVAVSHGWGRHQAHCESGESDSETLANMKHD